MINRVNKVVAALCLVLCATLLLGTVNAQMWRCPHANKVISCCKDIRVKQNGGLLNYNCNACDNGYKVSPSKNQCIPDIPSPCKSGYGPNLYNNGKCTKCSDPNCKDCSDAFYTCVQCKDNTQYIPGDGKCVPLVY